MIFTTNLDLWFAERLHHHLVVRPQQGRHLLGLGRAVWLTLLLPTLLLEFLDRNKMIIITMTWRIYGQVHLFTSSPKFMTAEVAL